MIPETVSNLQIVAVKAVVGVLLVASMATAMMSNMGGSQQREHMRPHIRVTGVGQVQIPMDTAYLAYSFSDTQKMASDALDHVSEASNKMTQHLMESRGLNASDIVSSGFSVGPAYDYTTASHPKMMGYTVTSSYTATICKLDTVSGIIDDVVRVGGPLASVGSLTFGAQKSQDAMDQARKLAIDDAAAKASLLLEEAGAKMGHLMFLDAEDVQSSSYPVYSRAKAAPGGMPVMAGESTITAGVTATYAIRMERMGEIEQN